MQNSQHLNNPTQATQSNIQIEDILVMSELKQQGAYKSNGNSQLFSIVLHDNSAHFGHRTIKGHTWKIIQFNWNIATGLQNIGQLCSESQKLSSSPPSLSEGKFLSLLSYLSHQKAISLAGDRIELERSAAELVFADLAPDSDQPPNQLGWTKTTKFFWLLAELPLDHLPHPRLLWVRYLVVEVCGKIIVSGGKGVKIRFNLFNKLIAYS